MIANQLTATYSLVNGKMVQNGYFIYGNGVSLKWVALNDIQEVYRAL